MDASHLCAELGRYDEAIDPLDAVLAAPAWFSKALLELDPMWDPLREHPRCPALVDKYR